jgi:hypothetical protein
MEGHSAELPAVRLSPAKPTGRLLVWIDQAGKAGLYQQDGSLQPHAVRLLDSGATILGVDLLDQGEFLADGRAPERQRWLPGEEAFAGWTYCYNLPLVARRAQDVLAAMEAGRSDTTIQSVDLVGLGGAGKWAALALAIAGGSVDRAAIDTIGFRFATLNDVYSADFLPGAVKYGDLPGALALAAPTRLWLAGETGAGLMLVRSAYQAAGEPARLTVSTDDPAKVLESAINWLTADATRTR